MKIQITENDINMMVAEAIVQLMTGKEGIFEASRTINDKMVRAGKRDLQRKIADMVANNDPNIKAIADNIGVNLNFDKAERKNMMKGLYDNGRISDKITQEVLDVSDILANYVSPGSNFDREGRMEQDYPDRYNELMRVKDFIDQMGLTHMYDTTFVSRNKQKIAALNGRYGLSIDDEGNVDKSKFDLNAYTDKDISDYVEGGMKKDKATGQKVLPSWARGKSQEQISDYVIGKRYEGILNKYLSSKYGLQVRMPGNVFSAGNNKLPSDTLIINFSSAQRCAAWNECIVKHACYARGTEHFRQNVRDANTQRNLMWASGENDPELMELLFNMVKAYCFDFISVGNELGLNPNELRTQKFSEMQPEVLESLQNHKRISDIRLNEDGDFIAQWLLDAWNEFAGELRNVGVSTTCYTCRKLNFASIKNIIINASNEGIKGPGVARYFFAVQEDMYELYDETYGGEDGALIFTKDENGNTKIEPNLQPLFDVNDGKPNGKYYYKCPCNRTDGQGENPEGKVNCYQCRICYEPNNLGKPYYVLVAVHGGARNDFVGRAPHFGVSKNYKAKAEAMEQKAAKRNAKSRKAVDQPVMESFLDMAKGFNRNVLSNPAVAGIRSLLDIKKSMQTAQRKAVKQITRNAIKSVTDHLSKL